MSPWTEIKQVKTSDYYYYNINYNIDSAILSGEKRKNEFIHKIYDWCGYGNMELLYRGSRDGMNADSFHAKCDDKDKTIVLIHKDKGNIFVGYSSIQFHGKEIVVGKTNLIVLSLH